MSMTQFSNKADSYKENTKNSKSNYTETTNH